MLHRLVAACDVTSRGQFARPSPVGHAFRKWIKCDIFAISRALSGDAFTYRYINAEGERTYILSIDRNGSWRIAIAIAWEDSSKYGVRFYSQNIVIGKSYDENLR